MNAHFLTWLIQNMQKHKNWTYKNSNNSHLQENSMRKFHESHIMQRLNYVLTDMLNTSHCIFTISKKNMTWYWNINNWESIIHKLIEFTKSWNLTHNIVKATVYTNYYDTFMITITQTQHNMNCSCLSFKINLSWMQKNMKTHYQKTTNTSHSKYVRYKLNHSIYLHKNKITRYSQSQ